jgi:hypothetical protein
MLEKVILQKQASRGLVLKSGLVSKTELVVDADEGSLVAVLPTGVDVEAAESWI